MGLKSQAAETKSVTFEKELHARAEVLAQRPMKTVNVNMADLEQAFERPNELDSWYLDCETGTCIRIPQGGFDSDEIDDEQRDAIDLIDSAEPGRFLFIEPHDLRPSVDDALEFTRTVEDERLRNALTRALEQRRHAFRQFLDILYEQPGEVDRWYHERRRLLWESIARWFVSEGVQLIFDPLPPYAPRHDARKHLLTGVTAFVQRAKTIEGVRRISLVGSMATAKKEPKDIDLLVTISRTDNLAPLAAAGRKLKGHAQQIGRGADVFLADESGRYLGRTCPWRECAPGIRIRCEAQHCGTYLYDDLQVITIAPEIIRSPPLEIWPEVIPRGAVPEDVLQAFAR